MTLWTSGEIYFYMDAMKAGLHIHAALLDLLPHRLGCSTINDAFLIQLQLRAVCAPNKLQLCYIHIHILLHHISTEYIHLPVCGSLNNKLELSIQTYRQALAADSRMLLKSVMVMTLIKQTARTFVLLSYLVPSYFPNIDSILMKHNVRCLCPSTIFSFLFP